MVLFIALGAFGKKKKPVTLTDEAEEETDTPPEEFISQRLKEFVGEYDSREEVVPEKEEDNFEGADETVLVIAGREEIIEKPSDKYNTHNIISEDIRDKSGNSGDLNEGGESVFTHFDYRDDHELSDGDLTRQEGKLPEKNIMYEIFMEMSKGFDVRRAIIFSEIINRKYF